MKQKILSDPYCFASLIDEMMGEFAPFHSKFGISPKYDRIWWRGQSKLCSEWELKPSIYRKDFSHLSERNVCADFIARAPTRYSGRCPSLAENASWLILMQHYGVPTRLLDWTESLLVALYFAVSEHDCAPGVLWALSPYLLNYNQIKMATILNPHAESSDPLFRSAYSPEDKCKPTPKVVAAVMAPHEDLRVLVQQSAFTVHNRSDALDELLKGTGSLLSVEIPVEQKRKCRTYLQKLGIRISTLFPDLEHLAQDIKANAP